MACQQVGVHILSLLRLKINRRDRKSKDLDDAITTGRLLDAPPAPDAPPAAVHSSFRPPAPASSRQTASFERS